jgi:hypothetical protein
MVVVVVVVSQISPDEDMMVQSGHHGACGLDLCVLRCDR